MEAAAIVLAAGAGTRMKSKKPKVAHEVLGKPLVRWVVDAAREAGVQRVVSVVGHARGQVEPLVADTQAVVQTEQNGTAGAVAVCKDALADFDGSLVVLSGDCPLITADTIARLAAVREENDAAVVVLTMQLDDPFGYGRIVRDEQGAVARIVEQKDANSAEAAICECNSGFYCFDARALFDALEQVGNDNAQGEFYLTDVLEICRNAGRPVLALACDDPAECLGVNSRIQLAEATKLAQRRTDTVVGRGCVIDETVAVEARIDDGASCGPRAYLRPAAHLCEGAKAGTHVEIKKSTVGKGSKVPHLSYIGDTTIGEDVNVGAGSITCNYDGKKKHATTIGDGAFIGSDTMMVAPVNIGAGAIIGAGSCITKDVAPDALALTRPEQREIPGWAAKKRERQG